MRRFTLLLAVALAAAACGERTKRPPDAGPYSDADPGTPLDGGARDAEPAPDAVTPDAEPAPDAAAPDAAPEDAAAPDAEPEDTGTPDGGPRQIVILMIGDGMGKGQLEAASIYRHGQPGQLFMQSLPNRGEIETGGLSGITDSAAAATAMATGVKTYNGDLGIDRNGNAVETILERAQREGYGASIVTTASLPHATPAAFSAHISERSQYVQIADDQARNVRPLVALGGGQLFYYRQGPDSARTDDGLIDPLVADGWQFVSTADQLANVSAAPGAKVIGTFAPEHMDYARERPASSPQPTLTEMSLAALRVLDAYPRGFFLMIEGARIDMASHGNDLANAIGETLDFDDTIQAVSAWAQGRDDVTLIVTADHECGGLSVVTSHGAGVLPEVTWRWGQHTNARIEIFGSGPGTEQLSGIHDHTWVHALAVSELFEEPLVPPPVVLTPDGRLAEHRHRASVQTASTAFGAGFNQLDALWLDADRYGLLVGVEGLFEWDHNAIVVLVDVDFGASTGFPGIAGALADTTGRADGILTALQHTSPNIAGFGADFALVSFGGADPKIEELITDAGLRGLRAPMGQPNNLGWYSASINFGEDVRVRGLPGTARPGEGFEAFVPWSNLYPGMNGMVPPSAVLAIAAVLVNDDGGFASNQALPPFTPALATNPGRNPIALPGVVTFAIDADGDGIGDGATSPITVPASP